MMKMKIYPCQSSRTYLILLIFAALTLSGYAQYDGDITQEPSGLVKIYYNGKWGAICGTRTFTEQSKVICRSLGLKYTSHSRTYSSLPVYTSSMVCRGDEKSLFECSSTYLTSYAYCYSYYKLSLNCQGNLTETYCSFDNSMCEMVSEGPNDYTWERIYPKKHSGLSGPRSDHTTKYGAGKYMFASAGSFPGQKTYLKTKAVYGYIGSISFYYHMFGNDMGSLNIYTKTDNSSKIVIRSISGNQGDEWKYLCLPVPMIHGYHEIIFEAVHGKGLQSDIALDDVTISTKNSCSNWNVSCNFNEDTCNYDIENDNINIGWRKQKIYRLKDHSDYGDYLVFNSGSYYFGKRNSLISPLIDIPSLKTKVSFYYYMPGTGNGELQVRFVEKKHKRWFTEAPSFWQDSGDHGTKWQYGCMNLSSGKGNLIFTGIYGKSTIMALDDIVIDEGHCQTGITNHECTFENPLFCEYTINCMNLNEFTWRRNSGSTSSSGTGPNTDNSIKTNGHYMYAEASYGMPNDTTELNFKVSNVKGKYVTFAYNMYGSGVGQLKVVFNIKALDEKIVWTMKGNKGLYWHKVCQFIHTDIDDITFIAVRGYSYQGDIAIDSVSIENRACDGPFDCDFQNGMCRYKVYNSGLSSKLYTSNSYSSDSNSYLYIYSYSSTENRVFEMRTPQAFVKENSSVSFQYKMTGYMKEIAVFTYDSYSKNKSWSSNYNDITEFTTACVDFPFSTDTVLSFQLTSNAKSYYNAFAALDDILISNETCKLGITYHFCKFKEVHLCNYHVECLENTKYNWSRGSLRNYKIIRPENSSYNTEEYFMFADSSFGKIEDKTHLVFSNVVPPAGYSLYFSYLLQKDSGKLQLHHVNWNGRNLIFEEFSVVESVWQSACVNVNNTYTDIAFTATKGYGFARYIALMDVGFKQEYCQARSISCDFSNYMICQYGSIKYNKWERIFSGNVDNSTDGFYIETTPTYYESGLVSPTENITNSCVQIRYKIINKNCNLTIYNAFNNKSILSTVSDDTTPWETAQIYIQEEAIKLVFLARNIYSWEGSCRVLLDNVQVTENNCTQLDCPAGKRKCKNNYCYSESKVCDRINDCSDGSDEENCPTSLACDFKSKYLCDYKIVNGWIPNLYNNWAAINIPDSIQIIATDGKMLSPYVTLPYSCVKFKFVTHAALIGNFSIILTQWNTPDGVSHSLKWNEVYFNKKDGSYEGQFQFPAGKGFLEFRANIKSGGLAIDDIIVSNGTCPELNCSKNSYSCSDNKKCINKKNMCNNYKNCDDHSDEKHCSKFFSCNFEDSNMCGFKSYPKADSWILSNGFSGKRPKLDHSERTYEGQYVMSNSSGENHLQLPTMTIENTFCLNFYYTFFGKGNVSVYGNDTYLMSLSKFDSDIWRNAKITLPKGIHNVYFTFSNNNISGIHGTVAVDSVSIISGKCSQIDCEENWYPCNDNYTCFPYTEKCDGINNCPNGEDEYNCTSNKPEYKLVAGRSLQSGSLHKRYHSQYLPVCAYTIYEKGVKDICSQLGFNGTVTKQTKTGYVTGDYYSCRYYSYMYCSKRRCSGQCYCYSPYVTCSNTICEDGEVNCPQGRNGTNSTDVCIRRDSLCNGQIDCEGGTDEEDCDQCTDEQWQCRNKKCIKKDFRCNGIQDCKDGSDEFHCFRYINDKTIQVFYNGSYRYICEDNLKNEIVANQLCSYVGRSNGTFDNSILEDGVLFTFNASNSDNQLIPGFEVNSFRKCNITMLNCSKQQCGTQMIDFSEPNIRYGHNALDGEWPWVVIIYRNSIFICTGILINTHYVLTAAHCLISMKYYTYHIKVGSTKRDQGQNYTVAYPMQHDNYLNYKYGYDIGLLYVKEEIEMSPTTQPICLPEYPASKDKECYVTGWGRDENGKLPPILQESKVYLLEESTCKTFYSFIKNTTICANHKDDNQPICNGDSGGPLACRNIHGNWVAYGISSFGKSGCTGPDSAPAAFADIYKLMPWINKYI